MAVHPSPRPTAKARRTVVVEELTNGLLGPDVPMGGPVADGGHVVRVTFRAPVDRLADCGLLGYAEEQYGPTPSPGRPTGDGRGAGGGEGGDVAARPGTDGTVPSGA